MTRHTRGRAGRADGTADSRPTSQPHQRGRETTDHQSTGTTRTGGRDSERTSDQGERTADQERRQRTADGTGRPDDQSKTADGGRQTASRTETSGRRRADQKEERAMTTRQTRTTTAGVVCAFCADQGQKTPKQTPATTTAADGETPLCAACRAAEQADAAWDAATEEEDKPKPNKETER